MPNFIDITRKSDGITSIIRVSTLVYIATVGEKTFAITNYKDEIAKILINPNSNGTDIRNLLCPTYNFASVIPSSENANHDPTLFINPAYIHSVTENNEDSDLCDITIEINPLKSMKITVHANIYDAMEFLD